MKEEVAMYDIYESVRAIAIPNVDQSLIDRFAAWCLLNKINKLDNTVKENFLEETLEGNGDLVERILAQIEDPISFIHFWHHDLEKIQLKKLDLKITAEQEKEFFQTWTKDKLADYLGIKMDTKTANVLVISSGKPDIKFYYFQKSGSIILADISLKESKKTSYDHAKFFKTLSDDTRIIIVNALSKGPKTATQLSEISGVSLSTVNHHLKPLIEERIVSLMIQSKEGKGAQYVFNPSKYSEALSNFHEMLGIASIEENKK